VLRRLAGDALQTENLYRPSVNSPAGVFLRTLNRNGMDPDLNYHISDCFQAGRIVVVGSNIAATQPIMWLEILKAVNGGSELILIGSEEYPFLRHASSWLRPHPGSEAFLLTALQELLPTDENDEAASHG
jgi:predicted molibdopterin-dependent oxidoreductase YjgC